MRSVTRAWLEALFSLSPGAKNPAKLPKLLVVPPSLDFRGMGGITRATFGKFERLYA
jgi:hypothetical protein